MESADIDDRLARIRSALAVLEKKRPAYRQMLAFYGPLFEAQERASDRIPTDAALLRRHPIEVRKKGGFSLLSAADFPLDVEAGKTLLREICRLARTAGEELAGPGEGIENALAAGQLAAETLLAAVIAPEDALLTRHAEALAVDRTLLATLCYHAIRPSLLAWSRRLAVDPGVSTDWQLAVCPICGSPPALSLLKEEGRRSLVCGFCWHEWSHRRAVCCFCRTAGNELRYFYDEAEPECRVDLCDACRNYLKAIDTRKTGRPAYPALEALATLHLDMKAQDMGYGGNLKSTD